MAEDVAVVGDGGVTAESAWAEEAAGAVGSGVARPPESSAEAASAEAASAAAASAAAASAAEARVRRAPIAAGPGLDDPASLEADARETRMERVAVLYAHITAITRDFLAAVAECDRHGDWAAEGFGSCAEWLAWRVGLQRNAASERVRVARALEDLPLTSEAMARGELSFSKVRAITRAATPHSEAELVELARSSSTANLERMVRAWQTLSREDEASRERLLQRTRRFSVVPDGEGMYVVRGRLSPEVAAVLMRAVDAASDALYASASEEERAETEPAQRRADAVGLLAERGLAAGFGRGTDRAREGDDSAADAPLSGSRAERYQVVLYVEPETLAATGEPGMSELDDGTRLSAETARRIACDASLVRMTRDGDALVRMSRDDASLVRMSRDEDAEPGDGAQRHEPAEPATCGCKAPGSSPLDVGRRTRTIPSALRRALEARDRGCRFPGCGSRFTDGHHIEHWADGGETKLSNLVLLCERHHRRVHEDGWTVFSDRTGQVVFYTPNGRALAGAPPMPELDLPTGYETALTGVDPAVVRETALAGVDPEVVRETGGGARVVRETGSGRNALVAELILSNLARGITPDARSNAPRYRHDDLIPWAIEAAAREALDREED